MTPSPPPPPTPPAIVSNCGAVRHDGTARATAAILNAAVGVILPAPITGVGTTPFGHVADSTVWTDLEADLENTTPVTIIGVRLGVTKDDGTSAVYDVPVTIAPNGEATASQPLARGNVQIGVTSCTVVRVNFSDGTNWSAPTLAPTPKR
jgi:hypothetical protein